ncbi:MULTISPECIES: hypothetical protein [unclassified Variovorax]|uniref:hypothetical protein n=1 Tax=unclassified Variovorax TaxID=663243 RepID=UPI00076DDFDD|nr:MULTISPECIES: hypothetical protein [unclassified Variovorax]KWT89322.1 hypothetical protein APY03_3401 [Variovorax sp. WDL1]PNG56499.1 hypothetical protein CHC07_02916 [Variovorax sp. B4]PNG57922.1 hypothetical protein CHC06_02918 [Variovorax sp. B2]VTV09615.1 hypothetical protein WDL1CHR_00708 [Variovorax sp. WDL1]
MRAIARNWEQVTTGVLFLISVYGAVYLVRIGALGWAGMALCCAIGFFQALESFAFAADWRERVRRKQQGDAHLDG